MNVEKHNLSREGKPTHSTKIMPIQRCAIYTRVSTDHGLEMEFNSLDAQREACEAYITSQKHEGWHCLPGQYNDGGFSGGSLERPDLIRLMTDIRAGKLDIIVVYKVDRLTRSLADFAKLVELFDVHKVSFVSVTQSFNTTSSMGRLTLNVLLSFAQFEREVTGERIRDKIAASKKKGIRMGGPVPLGYSLKDKKLIIDEAEAQTVRTIFEGYLKYGSLTALMRHLDQIGIVTKRTTGRDGSSRGGVRFGKGSLAYLLRNRIYIGEIIHKDRYYPAEHQPIIEKPLFDAVQDELTRSEKDQTKSRVKTKELFQLADKVFDDRGNRMTPTIARKNGAHYRYYICSALAQGRHFEAGSITRVSAPIIENLITQHFNKRDDQTSETLGFESIDRVIISKDMLCISFKPDNNMTAQTVKIPWKPETQRRKRLIITPEKDTHTRPIRAETRARLLLGIAKARHWLDELVTGKVTNLRSIAERERCSERSIRQTLNLAFLSPAIMKAAMDGTLPDGAGIMKLIDAPVVWPEQLRNISPD